MRRRRSAGVGAGVVAAVLALATAALAAGAVNFAAGKRSKPPYLFMTVAHGKVTKVSWDIRETCPQIGAAGFQTGGGVLNAPIKRGHFSKRVTKTIYGPSPLATTIVKTTVSGSIAGKTATVKVSDTETDFSSGRCTGSHRFTLHATTRAH